MQKSCIREIRWEGLCWHTCRYQYMERDVLWGPTWKETYKHTRKSPMTTICRNQGSEKSVVRVSVDIHVVPVHEKRRITQTWMKRDLETNTNRWKYQQDAKILDPRIRWESLCWHTCRTSTWKETYYEDLREKRRIDTHNKSPMTAKDCVFVSVFNKSPMTAKAWIQRIRGESLSCHTCRPLAPMNHVKILKGWSPRDSLSKLVQVWYKTFPPD